MANGSGNPHFANPPAAWRVILLSAPPGAREGEASRAMPDQWIQSRVRDELILRIESEMAAYLFANAGATSSIPVIGADARTGVPRRQMIEPRALAAWLAQENKT
jgi:hypothetical protein